MNLEWYWGGIGWYWVVLAPILHMDSMVAATIALRQCIGKTKQLLTIRDMAAQVRCCLKGYWKRPYFVYIILGGCNTAFHGSHL